MAHIKGNIILLTQEEIASIMIPFDRNKPSIVLSDGHGKYVAYQIDFTKKYIYKENNQIQVKEI